MGKNKIVKKTKKTGRHAATLMLPSMASVDELSMTSDNDLFDRQRALESERLELFESNFEVTSWDVELAYIQREFQSRSISRNVQSTMINDELRGITRDHDIYDAVSEAELDNTAYVRLSEYRDNLRGFVTN